MVVVDSVVEVDDVVVDVIGSAVVVHVVAIVVVGIVSVTNNACTRKLVYCFVLIFGST